MFVLLCSGFGTFPAQGKMRMVCRTFAILTLTCYFILNKMMLDLTGKGMFQRGVNHGWYCLWCTSYMLLWCPNGAVLCKVALQELTLFYKQLELGTRLLRPNSLTKCIPVNFQPLSLIYCIPLVKDQSSFYEICRI